MATPRDSFDSLCHNVFIANAETGFDQPPPIPTNEETALGLVSQAKVYELPTSYPIPASFFSSTTITPAAATTAAAASQDRRCYRIHLETIEDPIIRQKVHHILVNAIDPTALLELPFDRNLSGYNSKTRAESQESALEAPVVLDMGELSEPSGEGQESATGDQQSTENNNKTMLLLPAPEWLRMSGRVRFWREESHRIKAAKREVVLDGLLNERWKLLPSASIVSSPPPASGSLVAAAIPSASLPSSSASSTTPSPTSSPTAFQAHMPTSITRPSACRQLFQEHQLETLAQYMTQFGDELSASSTLRGLLNLIRRQLTEEKVLSWTFYRANLTEQKSEVTVAFLDLLAKLGVELVETNTTTATAASSPVNEVNSSSSSVSDTTIAGTATGAADNKAKSHSIELTWTFGAKIEDRRLEYWIQNIQKASLPVLNSDTHSTPLNQTLPLSNADIKSNQSQNGRKKNPVPATILKRFLQDRHTIPAGSIQFLMTEANSLEATSKDPETSATSLPIIRDRSFVLTSSRYAMSSTNTTSSELLVNRVKNDVKYLARWATSCGGRLDWLWAWLFSSFHKSRYGSSPNIASAGSSERRPPRSNDENV
ncbi:hypothetical protein BGX27_001321 [Mortierella sp. AM989]|nr:hypothetical protein BGX27_001321 [Mortierella sp. AM989]